MNMVCCREELLGNREKLKKMYGGELPLSSLLTLAVPEVRRWFRTEVEEGRAPGVQRPCGQNTHASLLSLSE